MAKFVYFGTGVLALIAALLAAMFALGSGAGWAYLLPAVLAVVLLVCGLPLSAGNPALGAKLSGGGAAVGGLVVGAMLVELVRVIPFREQPEQGTMLVVPGLLVLVSLLHCGAAWFRWRRIGEG